MQAVVAEVDARLTGYQEVMGLIPPLPPLPPPPYSSQHSFVEIDHEILSMVILSLPLIQEGQLSVLAKPAQKSVVRQTDCAWHDPIGLTGP